MSNLQACRACTKSLRFARTPSGKRMPLDPRPVRDGNVRLENGPDGVTAVTLVGAELERVRQSGEPLYVSHFVTCPNADQFRKKRKRQRVAARKGDR